MLKIRRPLGRLIFNMGIAIPGKTVFLIETAPRCSFFLFVSKLASFFFIWGGGGGVTSSDGNISVLLTICEGWDIHLIISLRPMTRSFDVFFDQRLNKRLRKQSWGWWFKTPWRSLGRHCNGLLTSLIPLNCIQLMSSYHRGKLRYMYPFNIQTPHFISQTPIFFYKLGFLLGNQSYPPWYNFNIVDTIWKRTQVSYCHYDWF